MANLSMIDPDELASLRAELALLRSVYDAVRRCAVGSLGWRESGPHWATALASLDEYHGAYRAALAAAEANKNQQAGGEGGSATRKDAVTPASASEVIGRSPSPPAPSASVVTAGYCAVLPLKLSPRWDRYGVPAECWSMPEDRVVGVSLLAHEVEAAEAEVARLKGEVERLEGERDSLDETLADVGSLVSVDDGDEYALIYGRVQDALSSLVLAQAKARAPDPLRKAAAVAALLRSLEWSGERWECNPNNERTCPSCFSRWTRQRSHAATCPLAAAIRALDAGQTAAPRAGEAVDPVNHPSHYIRGGIEAIDVIEAWGLDFCAGNALKYLARAGHKGDAVEDLRKARWYIDRALSARAAAGSGAVSSATNAATSGKEKK